MSSIIYRQYLAVTAMEKRVTAAGGQLDQYIEFEGTSADVWRENAAQAPDDKDAQTFKMIYAAVRTHLAPQSGDLRAIMAKLKAIYPDFVEFEVGGRLRLYFEPLDGIGVTLDAYRTI